MPFFKHDGLDFHYRERGEGTPFIFQHGLGGNVQQPFGLLRPSPNVFRLLAFDCRAHGETRPLGEPEKICFETFADDLLAFMDFLQLRRAIVGGISMGAALALKFVLRYPERVDGLVLSRPAWLAGPMIENAQIYAEIARLIREKGPVEGQAIFKDTALYRDVACESPDAAESLLGQFSSPRAAETVVKLERIPRDTPLDDLNDLTAIRAPTLVMANRQDPIHPFAFGETLGRLIPGAGFQELTPKSVSKERHADDVTFCIARFLAGAVQKSR
jgi:pimeloyl-ACP methyl ester carboxylesterase